MAFATTAAVDLEFDLRRAWGMAAEALRRLARGYADVAAWLLVLLLCYQGHDGYQFIYRFSDGTYERTAVERYDASRFRLVRTYATTRAGLPVRGCPRTVDTFEWRSGVLYYLSTDNWYDKTRVVYTPGHRWLSSSEQAGYATHAYTQGTVATLVDADGDCNAEAAVTKPIGTHDVWHAAYADQPITTPFTGAVTATVLDQVTVVNGWDDYWKERWWIYQHPVYGAIPVASMGWRKLPGGPEQTLWSQVLVAVER